MNFIKKQVFNFKLLYNYFIFNFKNKIHLEDKMVKYSFYNKNTFKNINYFNSLNDKEYGGESEITYKYNEAEECLDLNFKIQCSDHSKLLFHANCAIFHLSPLYYNVDNYDMIRVKMKGNTRLGIMLLHNMFLINDTFNISYILGKDEYQEYDFPIDYFKGYISQQTFMKELVGVKGIGFFYSDILNYETSCKIKEVSLIRLDKENRKNLSNVFLKTQFMNPDEYLDKYVKVKYKNQNIKNKPKRKNIVDNL